MPSADLFWAFFAAAAVYAYMPGPAMLYAAAQTLGRGRRAGYMAALGIHIGGYAHVLAAAFGLSALFRLVPEAYLVLKLVGAAYLIFLGAGLIRQAFVGGQAGDRPTSPRTARRALVDSMLVEVLNPKTALFFLAFLPQFTDPAGSLAIWAQMLALGVIVNLMFSFADLLCVAFAGAISRRLSRSNALQRLARGLGGTLQIGVA